LVDEGLCDWAGIFAESGPDALATSASTPVHASRKPHEIPLLYGDRSLGRLRWIGQSLSELEESGRSGLTAFASQVAALLASPSLEGAIALDRRMAQLKQDQPSCDWCGVYLLRGETLFLTAFRGEPTPHPIIPRSRGICGAAVAENRTLNIEDVQADPRYLSCDIRTRSELVVPIRDSRGEPIGEVDIDSHRSAAFPPAVVEHVEELAREIATLML
jgi:GAF domain-containing protein